MILRLSLCLGWLSIANACCAQSSQPPAIVPGSVYKEYVSSDMVSSNDWRVTNPEATPAGAREFLPNPKRVIKIDSLEGVVRAEAILDRWGGHLGTTNQRVRFNGGTWLDVQDPSIGAPGRANHYYYQDNPVLVVPLEQLREGENLFEGTCDAEHPGGWGQWGLYALTLRLYYPSDAQQAPRVAIVSPKPEESFGEDPTISVEAFGASGVSRVEVLACFSGYDLDGDGVGHEWQEARFKSAHHRPLETTGHVGTALAEPFDIVWNTRWVPDQPDGSISLLARVMGSNGFWRVSGTVDRLSLHRRGDSVQLYQGRIGEAFGVRVGEVRECVIKAPRLDTGRVVEAALALRTWHGWDGHHEPLRLNGHPFAIHGRNHFYDFDYRLIDPDWLVRGENIFRFESNTHHHALEVLAPGPAILVRTRQ